MRVKRRERVVVLGKLLKLGLGLAQHDLHLLILISRLGVICCELGMCCSCSVKLGGLCLERRHQLGLAGSSGSDGVVEISLESGGGSSLPADVGCSQRGGALVAKCLSQLSELETCLVKVALQRLVAVLQVCIVGSVHRLEHVHLCAKPLVLGLPVAGIDRGRAALTEWRLRRRMACLGGWLIGRSAGRARRRAGVDGGGATAPLGHLDERLPRVIQAHVAGN